MSLYRRYRPTSLADVLGQDHVVTTVEQALKQGRLSHAYLFAGPRGTGKTSIARILARAMLTHGLTDEARVAQILRGVEEGSLVDLVEIDAASNRRIDDIRLLLENIQFPPVAAAAKVYIIDEAHMLTKEAFNALLKTLEEPPPYAYFLLATTELHKVPVTIQSRCQRFQLRQLSVEDIVRRLQMVADQERLTVDRAALRAIAHHAQGGMRDALSILDQLQMLPSITVEEVKERVGDTGHDHAEQLLQAIDARDSAAALRLVAELDRLALPYEGILRLMLDGVRTRMHEAVRAGGKPDASDLASIEALLQALQDLRLAPVPGVALEAALLHLTGLTPPTTAPSPPPAVAARPTTPPPPPPPAPAAATPSVKTPAAEAPAPAPTPTAIPKPATEADARPTIIKAPALSLDAIQRAWPDVVKGVSIASVRMSLKDAQVTSLQGHTLLLTFASGFHREKVQATDASRHVEEVLQKLLHAPLKITCRTGGEALAGRSEDVVDLAQMASEVF
jgi:DNA polymerase-3 subunit gamma/tau